MSIGNPSRGSGLICLESWQRHVNLVELATAIKDLVDVSTLGDGAALACGVANLAQLAPLLKVRLLRAVSCALDVSSRDLSMGS